MDGSVASVDSKRMTMTVTAFRLSEDLIFQIMKAGAIPTVAQRKAVMVCMKASNTIMRIAMWIAFGLPPWKKLEVQEQSFGDSSNDRIADIVFNADEEDSYSA